MMNHYTTAYASAKVTAKLFPVNKEIVFGWNTWYAFALIGYVTIITIQTCILTDYNRARHLQKPSKQNEMENWHNK